MQRMASLADRIRHAHTDVATARQQMACHASISLAEKSS